MCPLIAKDGSPWTGDESAPCPEDENVCPWWAIACSTGGVRELVEHAVRGAPLPVFGPNKPSSYAADPAKIGRTFDCQKAAVCSWQKQAGHEGHKLCPPRYALGRGFDPRIVLF